MIRIDEVIKGFEIAKHHTGRIVTPSLMVKFLDIIYSKSCGGAFYPHQPVKYRRTVLTLPTENYSVLVARENGNCYYNL